MPTGVPPKRKRRRAKNIYVHEIELRSLELKNKPREVFRGMLENVKYRGYEVERLTDGRGIVITKPGGKYVYGKTKREDFMVWVYDPDEKTLWLVKHKDIYKDLEEKGSLDPREAVKVLDALERVYNGDDPDDVLRESRPVARVGEPPDLLLKAYKWIWGQEDCNYPTGKGRTMSWEGWEKKEGEWVRTGEGLADLREELRKAISKGNPVAGG